MQQQGAVKYYMLLHLFIFMVIIGCESMEWKKESSLPVFKHFDMKSLQLGVHADDVMNSVTITWQAPRTNDEGTALYDLAGYNVYYGASRNYSEKPIDVGDVTGAVIDNLSQGRWCFAVTAYDTYRNESTYSNEVCIDIEH